MKPSFLIPPTRLCIVFFLTSAIHPLFATDLTISMLYPPQNVVWEGDSEQVSFQVKNQNVLPADFFTSYITITKIGGGVVFNDVVESDTLLPDSTVTIKSNIKWKALTGRYRLDLYVDYQYDIDTTNNRLSTDFDVLISRDKAKKIFFNSLLDIVPDTAYTWAFMPSSVIDSGSVITSKDSREYTDSLISPKWFVYLDMEKNSLYQHPGYAITIDGYDSTLAHDSINWYPVIDSIPYMNDFGDKLDTADKLYGENPGMDSVPSFKVTYSDTTETTTHDTACAILVSGQIEKNSNWERETFTNDLDLMEGNLMKEKLGPRIPASHVIRIGNASRQEILNAISSLSDSCKKIYFYYAGHGAKYEMVTNDPDYNWLSYLDLAQALENTKAKDICVVLDACYSGSAEGDFRIISKGSKKNYTLITSSLSQKVSWMYNVFQLGDGTPFKASFFTWWFCKCFGDPAADVDGVPGTSLAEAYYCLRKENPKLLGGQSIDRLQNPQIMISRVAPPPPVNVPYTPPNLGVTVTSKTALDSTLHIHIAQYSDEDTLVATDDSIVYISPKRYWTFDMGGYTGSYDFNLKYNYDFNFDNVDTTKGKVGTVIRDSTGADWRYLPNGQIIKKSAETVLNTGDHSLNIFGITQPIDFAVAIVVDQNNPVNGTDSTTIIKDPFMGEGIWLYPNPANSYFTLQFNLSHADKVTAEVYSTDGRLISIQGDEYPAGINRIRFDMSVEADGLYLVRLRGKYINYVGKLLKQ